MCAECALAASYKLNLNINNNKKNTLENRNNKVTEMVQHHNMFLQRSSVLQLRSNWLDRVNSTQNQPFPSTQAGSARHSRGRISSRSVELLPEWHQAFAGLQRDKCFCQGLGWAELVQPNKGNKTGKKEKGNLKKKNQEYTRPTKYFGGLFMGYCCHHKR